MIPLLPHKSDNRSILTQTRVITLLIFAIVIMARSESHATDYSGQWNMSPCVSYTCTAFGLPAVQTSFCTITITDNYPNVIVQAPSVSPALVGTFSTPTKFSAQGTDFGSCNINNSITVDFSSPTSCSATFNITFSGTSCGVTTCTNQMRTFDASRTLPPCCTGLTGNVDCDQSDGVDISDLSTLIDNLYITFTPLCCDKEANVDGQPGIDIADLSALIDYLYISFTPPAPCQ